jgi:hypothetical protein
LLRLFVLVDDLIWDASDAGFDVLANICGLGGKLIVLLFRIATDVDVLLWFDVLDLKRKNDTIFLILTHFTWKALAMAQPIFLNNTAQFIHAFLYIHVVGWFGS